MRFRRGLAGFVSAENLPVPLLGSLLVLLFLSVDFAISYPSDPSLNSLRTLVNEYVYTHDADRADALLQQILSRDDASVSQLTSILAASRIYSTAPAGAQTNRQVQVDSQFFRYALYVPADYRPEEAYPLMVCLHGAGFSGDAYLERWQARLSDRYILACPTLKQGDWWTRTAERLVMATIRTVSDQYHVDPDRVFLTGMSNGGIGAYLIGAHHAPGFAAVIPMASGLDDVLKPLLQNYRHTPLYIIHGQRDEVMPVQLSRSIIDMLKELQYAFVYREHDRTHPMAGGHFFPREELTDLMTWLAQQRRERNPKSVTVVEDATHLSRFGWVRVDSTDRIASFSDALVDHQDDAIKQRRYARLEAQIKDNRIEVRTQRVRRYTLFMNDQLVDFARPIIIVTNGQTSYEGHLQVSAKTLLRERRLRPDPGALYPSSISVNVTSPE
jgi:poly(3-hydroxybutyrate) depolymerase